MTGPTFMPAAPPAHRGPQKRATTMRECDVCGWQVELQGKQFVPDHNESVMTKDGPAFSKKPCDGSRRAPAPICDLPGGAS